MRGWSCFGAPQMVVADAGAARRFKLLEKQLDERMRRCVAAAEAEVLGPRGISIVSRATGVSRQAIRRGVTELREPVRADLAGRIRQPGGGRKRTRDKDPTLLRDLEHLGSRPREAIRSRRCAGRARACASWRRSCSARAIASRISWLVSCCRSWATACRRIARRSKAPAIRIGTRSLSRSIGRCVRVYARATP